MPFANWKGGHNLFWTRERVISGLAIAATSFNGTLPCSDKEYNKFKKGHMDWPTSTRVYFYFRSMSRGWLAAGVDKNRVTLKNIRWLSEEETYLKEHAGEKTLKRIASDLCRSYDSVKRRLYDIGIIARDNPGYLSAAQVAQYYNCPYQRVRDALLTGVIPGKIDRVRNRWRVDLIELSPENKAMLLAPKKTHKSSRTDLGDYEKRHGLKRELANGRTVRVPAKT
jgi:hypothetical protein